MYQNLTPQRALKELESMLSEKMLQWDTGTREPNLFSLEAQYAMDYLVTLDEFLTGSTSSRSVKDVIMLKKLIRADIAEWEMVLSDGISSLLFRLETHGENHIRIHLSANTKIVVKWLDLCESIDPLTR